MFLTYVFYLMTIPALIYEFSVLFNPKRVIGAVDRIKDKMKTKTELSSMEAGWALLMLLYLGWTLVGLMSSQWVLFSALILVSLLMSIRIFGQRGRVFIRVIDAIISLMILFSIILNKFHFHVNLWEWIRNI